jgi:hypothetical protein
MSEHAPAGERVEMTVAEVEELCRLAATEAVTTALDGLRALPVEQRMDAMGMQRVEGMVDMEVLMQRGVLWAPREEWPT